MNKKIREEFKTFSYTTSLKGLPRFAKSDWSTLRWMWFFATIVFLGIAGWQCYELMSAYMEFPNVIDIDEIEMAGNFGPNAEGISVLLCNNDPLYSDPVEGMDLITLEEYYTMMDNLTSCFRSGECDYDYPEIDQNRIWKELRTRKGYFQYLGKENAYVLGHFEKTMIRSCEILYYDGLTIRDAPCDSNMTTTLMRQIPDYFNCFMWEVEGFLFEGKAEYPVVGIALILYMDSFRRGSQNSIKDIWDELRPKDFWKQGVRVSVYPYSEAHDIVRKGRDILPGHFTTLQIGLGYRERLPQPWGKCQQGETKYTLKKRTVNYSLYTCMSNCIEGGIVSNCSCHDANALGVLLDNYADMPFCGTMDHGTESMLKRMNCASKQRLHLYESCLGKCPLPCFEDTFEITMSTSEWPSTTQIEEFYYRYINGTNVQYRFPEPVPLDLVESGSDEVEFNRTKLLSAIRENFAMVQISLPDDTYFVITDREKISATELVSSLGAVLNLWAGITVLFFVEVIEVVIKICCDTKEEDIDVEERKSNVQMTAHRPPRNNIYVTEVVPS